MMKPAPRNLMRWVAFQINDKVAISFKQISATFLLWAFGCAVHTKAVTTPPIGSAPFLRHFFICSLIAAFYTGCGSKLEPSILDNPSHNTDSDFDTDSNIDSDSDSGGSTHSFTLRVIGDSQPLSSFVAVIRLNDTVRELQCPDATTVDIQCTGEEIRFQNISTSVHATIKSAGYAFVSRTWSINEISTQPQDTLHLTPLSPFESNNDYSTGFSPGSTAEDFLPFAHESGSNLGPQYLVKFYMELGDVPTVYFMNTNTHFLHYQFVHDILNSPLSEIEYQMQTYMDENRTAMAGTLMYFPEAAVSVRDSAATAVAPMVLTFFPSDRLTPQHAAAAHRLIEERLSFLHRMGDTQRLYYLPAGDQQESDLTDALPAFADAGIPCMKKSELYTGTSIQILNEGEAYGTLRILTADELKTAVFSFTDILLLATLPTELPLAGGTITEQLQTPLSHVNVAAMNRGTPNMALPDASQIEEISRLAQSLVHFVVDNGTYLLEPATLEAAEAFWAQQQPPEVSMTADTDFSDITDLTDVTFNDSIRFGAKAANVAELASLMPQHAPYGFAVPFYYYDQFTSAAQVTAQRCTDAQLDCVDEGRQPLLCETAQDICLQHTDTSLQQYIETVLALDAFSADAQLREAILDGIRHLFRNIPVAAALAETIDDRVLSMFGTAKVRLRSSTNAEDLENFSGAGLYESVSANAAMPDDLPSDEIRKVWASIWNYRAYEERSYWNINHLTVHMGVLVHQAFSDEAANGVLITRNLAEPTVEGFYVNVQKGETSVTNPTAGSPQIFAIIAGASSSAVQSAVYTYSSLAPDESILSDAEVTSLYNAALLAQEHFSELYQIPYWPLAVFDIEFKFHGPDRQLILKQLRPF